MNLVRIAHRCVMLLSAALLVGGFRPQVAGVRPTTEVVQHALRGIYRTVLEHVPTLPSHVSTTNHPDRLWLSQELYEVYPQSTTDDRGRTDTLLLIFGDVSLRYENTESVDSVRRIIVVDVGARYVADGKTAVLSLAPAIDTVVCSRMDARAAESSQHSCTSAPMPEPPSSFWDTVLEPMIFVAAAVATVVLLFTVRSQ